MSYVIFLWENKENSLLACIAVCDKGDKNEVAGYLLNEWRFS